MYQQKSNRFVLLLFSLTLAGILIACGGQSQSKESPPEQNQAEILPTHTVVVEATPTLTPAAMADTPTPAPEPTETALPEATPTEVAMTDTAAPLPNIPLPDDAQGVEFADTDLNFGSPSDTETLVEFYRQALPAGGWQESADFSQVDEIFAFVEFDRGDEVIHLTMTRIGDSTEVILDLSEALSLLPVAAEDATAQDALSDDAPGFAISDWPVPDEATEVKQSGDTLSYKTALKLADIAEFYRPTYELLELGTGCLDTAAEYTSMSCSLSNGDFSVNFCSIQ